MAEPNSNATRTQTVGGSSLPPPTDSRPETLGDLTMASAAVPGQFGEFVLLGELGRGGMGVVYRAEDQRLRREVALKVMLPQFAANPDAKARFVREARAQAKVEHDHVVAILQIADHDGLPYLVMPLLKGMTLHAALKANPRPPLNEVIRIGREVAEGLAAAHEKGLVHRDIKPANVWLEGRKLRVKVLDFGLARAADAEATDGPVTQEGAVIGTPAYMSPEQGRGLPIDGRTDLFSLGVMLYQMTTGELPFRGATTLAVLTSLALDNPPPPMTRNPAVPQALSDFVLRLLAKDPAYRPPTAEIAAEELRAIEAGLVNAVRVIPLDSPTPLILSNAGPDPFADLDATEANTAIEAETVDGGGTPDVPDVTRKPGGGFPMWAVVGGVLLAVAGVVGLVATQFVTKHVEVVTEDPPTPPPPTGKPLPFGGAAVAQAADRKAAEYVLSIGGRVRLNDQEDWISVAAELPRAHFRLTGVYLGVNKQVSDAGLVVFKDCKNLTHLELGQSPQVGDAGLAHFKDCKNLTYLSLIHCPLVGDAGLANFKDCKNWTHIELAYTQVSDVGLACFKDCKNLAYLGLADTKVGDAGLAQFKDCKNLTTLYLNSTKVSDAGVAHFKDCKNLRDLHLNNTKLSDAGLANFKDCKNLTSLWLSDTKVSDTGLTYFEDSKNLTDLYLKGTQVGDAGLAYLKDCKNLTRLYLYDTNVGDAGLAHFKDCNTLRHLVLLKTKVSVAGIDDLKQVLPQCKIDWDGGTIDPAVILAPDRKAAEYVLSVGGWVKVNDQADRISVTAELPKEPFRLTGVTLRSNTQVSDVGLVAFKGCKNLTSLDLLQNGQVGDAGLAHFKDCKNLTVLALQQCGPVSDAGLANFKDCKNLTHLWLYDCRQVSDAGLANFKDCKNLTELELGRTQVGDVGLANFKDCKNLTVLELDSTKVSDLGLANFKDCKNLTAIQLGGTKVSDLGLANFKDCKNLTNLYLHSTQVGDAGLANFKDCKNLTNLYLHSTQVGDAGLANFKDCKNLKDIQLSGTKVSDTGAAHFKNCKNLLHLRLSGTQVGDAGVANFKDCKDLRQLDLAGTQVGDAGLANFKDCKSLTNLNLEKSKVTAAGIAELAKSLPQCQIGWDGGVVEPKK